MAPSRRDFIMGAVAGAALPGFLAGRAGAQEPQFLAPTPACGDDDEVTIAQTEGPYFTPNSPSRRDLAADSPGGERITIGGFVLDTQCRPVGNALVEIWQADENGAYDNEGYKLRGHQMSDESGAWWFTTVVPGVYPGRTRHFHFKVQRPGGHVLTTQLYFPDEPQNARDRIFDQGLVLALEGISGESAGRFDFVLA